MTQNNSIELLLFSGEKCGICHALKPKLSQLTQSLQGVEFRVIQAEKEPRFAAGHSVFSVPTVLLLAEGREYRRYHGSFSVDILRTDLERLLHLMQS